MTQPIDPGLPLVLLDQMIEQQRKKVLEIARKFVPGVTLEDIRNSFDFPELEQSSRFNFEDGILSGYISARIAIATEMAKHDDTIPKASE